MIFAVHDWETTGLPLHSDARLGQQPKTIEFGGILTDGNEVISTTEFICNPEIQIEQIITDITGLTNDDLRGYGPFSDNLDALKAYFSAADVIISHNLSFDKRMLDFDLRRIGLTLVDVGWTDQIEICTVEQTFHMYGRRMRLTDLYNTLVGEYVQKHRAVDDVLLLHKVCQTLGVYESFERKKND
jgi:DNA polymerase III alpha subunit (gram-positive type)